MPRKIYTDPDIVVPRLKNKVKVLQAKVRQMRAENKNLRGKTERLLLLVEAPEERKHEHRRGRKPGLPSTDPDKVIRNLRIRIKSLEKKLNAPDEKRQKYVQEKPDYYYSFSGYFIMRKWAYYNGVTPMQAEILIVMSYYNYFFFTDCKVWNIYENKYSEALEKLIWMGFVIKVGGLPTSFHKKRSAYTLTQRGKDFQQDYKDFYDEKMQELIDRRRPMKNLSQYYFRDGKYFRRERKSNHDLRVERNGPLPGGSVSTFNRYRNVDGYGET